MSLAAVALAGALLLTQSSGGLEIRDVVPERYPVVSAVVRVLDDRGRAVPGLGTGDFRVTEDGKPVADLEVRPSFRDGGSLAVVLVLDTSFSMRGEPLDGAKAAARSFLDRLGPDDRVALVTFGRPPVERATFGAPSALTGIDELGAAGYTALYDAINLAVARLASETAKARAIVVLTDGGDDGSSLGFDAVRQVVAAAGLPVHAVGFISPEFVASPMQELALASRGSYRETGDPGELAALYRNIADELVAEYRVSYRSSAPTGPHRLQIVATTAGVDRSAERAFDVVAGTPATTVPVAVDDDGDPALALLLALVALGVVAVVGGLVAGARRGRSRPPPPAPGSSPAASPVPHVGPFLEGAGVSIPLTAGSVLIGRDPAAQVIVDDPTVSRYHAKLQVGPDGIWVEDLGSSNGTLLNGVRVERGLVRAGDALDIGDLHLVLRNGAE